MNPLQSIRIEKVTLNVGVGTGGEKLENAKTLLERLSESKAVLTEAHSRNPTWKIRKGDEIGVKVTLRGEKATVFVRKALDAVDNVLKPSSFDRAGNVAFGVKEYIDFPGAKYDPKIGMLGFDVCVTLTKPGARVQRRRVAPRRVPARQRVSPEQAREFMEKTFNVHPAE